MEKPIAHMKYDLKKESFDMTMNEKCKVQKVSSKIHAWICSKSHIKLHTFTPKYHSEDFSNGNL